MSLLIKSAAPKRIASLLATKIENGVVVSAINKAPSAAALFHRGSPRDSPLASASQKADKNIVVSPHGDCQLHDMNLVHRFFDNATRYSNKIALECGITGRKYTYEMMRQLVRRYGSALIRAGFKKGEVMGMVSPNVPEFPVALLGATSAGMPVALVNPVYTPDEIARQLSAVGATAVFGVAQMAESLLQVAKLCPTVRRVILLGPPVEGAISFQQMVQDSGDMFNDNLDIDIYEDVFILPHSSGTTGMPKSVMLTHSNVSANVSQNLHPGSHTNQTATENHQEVNICLLPFFHSYGITGIMTIGFDLGARMITLPRFDVQSYLKAIENHKPTLLHVVPTLAQLFVNHPALKMEGFERLHTIFSAAAPLGEKTAVRLVDKFKHLNLVVQEGYGLSEMSPGTTLTPLDNSQLGSCGRLISRTKARIVDLETGENLGPNQQGELYVTGPQVMKGYWNNAKATEEMIDPEGWLRTGDVAYYDDKGNFFIVDRLKELIKVKGFQVAPAELEDILATHPAVLEAAVIGIPDNHAGELPRAYVIKKPGMESVSDAEIQAFIDSKVSAHKRLKGGIEFVGSLPKNNLGKLLRRELRVQFAQKK